MITRWKLAAFVAAAVGFAAAAGPARAESGELTVTDRAKVFSEDGVRAAREAFKDVNFKAPTQFTVATYAGLPDSKRDRFERAKGDKNAENAFFKEWAQELAKARDARGPFVVITMNPRHIQAIDDRLTDVKRGFGDDPLGDLYKKFADAMSKGTKEPDEAKRHALHDAGLLAATNYVAKELKDTTVPRSGKKGGAAASDAGDAADAADKGTSIMSYVCIGLALLLGVWLIIGIFRGLTSRGGGGGYGGGGGAPGYGAGGGYGGGGYGGGGGGGGGGFMSGMLGGMLGGVAGSWAYNSMFGGGHSAGGGYAGGGAAPVDTGATAGGGTYDDGGAGNYAGGGSAGGSFGDDAGSTGADYGGGDFGGDAGGGDTGGGDFGGDSGGGADYGGGDFGGGGDSGGGGGDF